jgi:hypothetical protein
MDIIPLESVRVAAPCHADWDRMAGDERARFCGSCEKHVYNLSGMTRMEAETLVREREGEICVRFARRKDGTVITGDCPVGLTAKHAAFERTQRLAASVLTVLLLPALTLVGGFLLVTNPHLRPSPDAPGGVHLRQLQPFKAMQHVKFVKAVLDSVDPPPPPPPMMGLMVG